MSAISDTIDVAGRNLRTLFRTPQALIFATIQPVIFVLLFRYAFGGAIRVPGEDYVDYLMPGIFAQSVAFGAIGTAVGLSADLRSGILVRFRTLPMACSQPGMAAAGTKAAEVKTSRKTTGTPAA